MLHGFQISSVSFRFTFPLFQFLTISTLLAVLPFISLRSAPFPDSNLLVAASGFDFVWTFFVMASDGTRFCGPDG